MMEILGLLFPAKVIHGSKCLTAAGFEEFKGFFRNFSLTPQRADRIQSRGPLGFMALRSVLSMVPLSCKRTGRERRVNTDHSVCKMRSL